MNAEWSLADFRGDGYDKGRSVPVQALWFAALNLVFVKWWCPSSVRVLLLRFFGARIGRGVIIRHRARVHWPWKLELADHVWIGEDVWMMNLEPLAIGSNTCVSQGARLICGSHDRHSPSFEFDNAPIVIGEGVWIAAGATVLRGSVVGDHAVVAAGAVAAGEVAPHAMVKP